MANCLYWREEWCMNPKPCTWRKDHGGCILSGQLKDYGARTPNKDLEQLGIHYKKRLTI